MKKSLLILLFAAFAAHLALGQQQVIKLPSVPAPADITWPTPEREYFSNIFNTQVVTNVSEPSLSVFLPEKSKATGTAVIVCPGGGFHALSINSEGNDVAKWLNERGVAAFVLKYRLAPTGEDGVKDLMTKIGDIKQLEESTAAIIKLAAADGMAAVAYVREHAAEWGIWPNRIGIIGFSAGGTVASATGYLYNPESRPDFVAPIYSSERMVREGTVPVDAPPMFALAATDDQLGLAQGSVALYNKWVAAGKSAELHLYSKGGHGFGMRQQNLPSDHWIDRFGDWLQVQGLLQNYRDLNKNGKKDIYEDPTQPIDARVEDVLKQMNLAEKAGMMFINGTLVNGDGSIEKKPNAQGSAARLPSSIDLIQQKQMNHFNYWQAPGIRELAIGYNLMQKVAENSRLGIPVTIASDPRHYFSNQIFAMSANGFSQWPEQLGFAAIGDTALMRRFGDIARQEYVAVGIREALHPMADLATEPRWARVSGTFGEDAGLSAKMTYAYVQGFQGARLGAQSVACMTKHFSGGGPQKEGLDPHFEFHKGQVYPGNNFDYHVKPFDGAFKANTASLMLYYGVPVGQTSENVGFAFNKEIVTGLLRNKLNYTGVVCTDWGLITDTKMGPVTWPARAWGVEQLSEKERVLKVIEAGVDQFGGESRPDLVVALVEEGKLSEKRIDESVRRLLRQKFQLGLFDNPYVDVAKALKTVGKPEFSALGEATQRRSFTLLKNDKKVLPLKAKKIKIYVRNVDKKVAAQYGTVVDDPKAADIAILRLNAPWYPVETQNPMARGFHHGDLDFKGTALDSILTLCKTVPTIVDIYLDRPAVIPEISKLAKALLANYGASDAALLDVIFGKAKPEGRLPFELPSSMEAVRKQKEDVPYDSEKPLFKFGFGLTY